MPEPTIVTKQMIEQIFESTGERRTIDRAREYHDISGSDSVDDRGGVIAVGVGRTAVGERDMHIG